jgi:hypothetical protein
MECLICLDTIEENELFSSECGHHFHHKCILLEFAEQCNTYFMKNLSCPYCRNILKDSEVLRKKEIITNIHGSPENIVITKTWGFLNEPYDHEKCCALTTNGNQCKKKKINIESVHDIKSTYIDEQSLLYVNSFQFVKDNLCTFHSKNIKKVKRFQHPYFKWIFFMKHM